MKNKKISKVVLSVLTSGMRKQERISESSNRL